MIKKREGLYNFANKSNLIPKFFNLKHYTVHNIFEDETPVSQTHMGYIYLPSDRAPVSNILEILLYRYQFKIKGIPYYCPLVLSTKGIASVTIKLKVFSLL